MAVLEVNLLFTGRGAKEGLDHHRTYTRHYEVITNNQADDEQTVGNAIGIPRLGTTFAPDIYAVASNVDVQQSDDSPYIWRVTVEYDSHTATGERDKPDNKVDLDGKTIDKAHQDNPLNEPAVWTLTFQDSEEPAVEWVEVDNAGNLVIPLPPAWAGATTYKTGTYVTNGANVYVCTLGGVSAGAGGPGGVGSGIADGAAVWGFYAPFAQTQNDPNFAIRAAVTTSANLPFDPPAHTEVSRIVLSVTKNMPIATLEYLLALKNAVNRFTWRGVPTRCAKIKSVTHDGGKEKSGTQYVTTKWEIGLDGDTWDLRLLDAGYGYLQTRTDPATNLPVTKYTRYTDINGQPLEHPVPLNGRGAPLDPNDAPVFRRGVPRQTRIIDFNTVLPF